VTAPQRGWTYTFTQEWPVGGPIHQLSYTIPYQSIANDHARGIGDVMLNYRYQLWADGNWAWVSPRLSVILPTGNNHQGLGNGSIGVQGAAALSKKISDLFVVHGNLGCTVVFSAGTPISYYGGASIIWQTSAYFNFMLESLALSEATISSSGDINRETEITLNPGFRFALNLSHLQVVPGIACPVIFQNQQANVSWFFYLSFEHPF
jgi:hypothetical protein